MFGKKMMSVLTLTIMIMSLVVGSVSADSFVNVDIVDFEINGRTMTEDKVLEVELGDVLEIDMEVMCTAEVDEAISQYCAEGVEIGARLVYKYSEHDNNIADWTNDFKLHNGVTALKSLEVQVPYEMNTDEMSLHIYVADQHGSYTQKYDIDVVGVDNSDAIRFVKTQLNYPVLTAGEIRSITPKVVVKNYGTEDFDDVYLTVRIPALGVQQELQSIELDAGEERVFEDLWLRIPSDAEAGVYTVEYLVEFDRYENVEAFDKLTIEAGEETSETENTKTVVTVPDTQSLVVGGAGVAYPVVIANMGNDAKSYVLTVQGVESWGTSRIDPVATIVVPAGETVTAFLYVSANENAVAGDKVFQLTINDGKESKQIPLTANVAEAEGNWDGLKTVLEVGLIVLVIILIVIGLIVGFNKLRGNDEEDDEDKTYY